MEIIEILNYWHTRELDDCCSTFTTQTKWWLGKKTTAANILSLNYQAEKADEQKREGGNVCNSEWKDKHVKKKI